MSLKFCFSFCLLLLTMNVLSGQAEYYTLRDKVGLVRLYMNQPKITHYESLVNNAKLTPDQRNEAKIALEKFLIDRKVYISNAMESFDLNYEITPVYFIPDSLWRSFKADKTGKYFLGKDGLIDPTISLASNQDFYIIAQENYDYDFRILTSEGSPPPGNFPYKLKHSLFSKIRALMGSMATESVKRLNKQLKSYQ
ncbi:MAG TPA: hypothetical protein PLY70_00355 [Saprospiraceae bacterium]|nr:hypothetical protein [Saprospiraceae bacterium]HPN70696.1 hypothetical protein [Saprospiraceae bacterium]